MGNKVLDSIKEELWKGFTTRDEVISGKKWTLKTLNEGEEAWRDRYIIASASMNFFTGKKAPTVAISLIAIDGVSVKELFLLGEETDKPQQGEIVQRTVDAWLKQTGFGSSDERYKAAEKVLEFMQGLPPEVVTKLYQGCLELEKQRMEALDAILKKT